MKTIRFGVIGCGLMGREFVSAALRWHHLLDMPARPEIVAICNRSEQPVRWFTQACPSIRQVTTDYRELLANKDVDAVYIAVPHNLHEEMYVAAVEAGKHLMGEKPFGIDKRANDAILAAVRKHPNVFVRCSSEFPFFPAVQRIGDWIDAGAFGRVIEVNSFFLHSSDLDPNKAINWKRMIEFNGEYGCMGDLGMHPCHVPFRAGWFPRNVRAILCDIIKQRPDGKGTLVPCRTWDNSTLFCEACDAASGENFPLTIKAQRIAPGQKNTWSIEVLGTKKSTRFSTANPKLLEVLDFSGGSEQVWGQIQMGHETTFKSITGGIFEFGFSDSILQMWASFLYELAAGKPLRKFAGCVTPDEVAYCHRLFSASLESHRTSATVEV